MVWKPIHGTSILLFFKGFGRKIPKTKSNHISFWLDKNWYKSLLRQASASGNFPVERWRLWVSLTWRILTTAGPARTFRPVRFTTGLSDTKNDGLEIIGYHFGHSSMHKQTGYAKRPQILYSAETVELVNAYLSHCRDMKKINLPMKIEKYIPKIPPPMQVHSNFSFEVYRPEQVKYFKKLAKKKNF